MNEDQRQQWKRALAAKAAEQRRRRAGPRARGARIVGGQAIAGAGMLRIRPPATSREDGR